MEIWNRAVLIRVIKESLLVHDIWEKAWKKTKVKEEGNSI